MDFQITEIGKGQDNADNADEAFRLTVVNLVPACTLPSAKLQNAAAAHEKAKTRVKSAQKKTMLVRSEQMVKMVVSMASER